MTQSLKRSRKKYVDLKINSALTLHKQILLFFTMRQGQIESEDKYLTRFNARVKSLEMLGGEHIFVLHKNSTRRLAKHHKTKPIKKKAVFGDVLFYL